MGKTEGHVVLYRKYRSRNFSEVVGQDHIVKPLQQSIASGKIAHAYLFTGPRGTGKTSIARIFANEINGFDYNDQLPIDIIEIDGASNRRIDEVRELKERIHTAPVQAKYKVYIIDEVHMLTKEAFNALLKTLEEPPEHAVFILATTEVHKLPATIISRAQRYAFRLVPIDVVVGHLRFICEKESLKFNETALLTIAKMGQGSFRDSISLLDQVSSTGEISDENVASSLGIAEQESIGKIVDAVTSATPKEIIANLQNLLMTGSSSTQVTKQIIDYIRSMGNLNEIWLGLIDQLLEVSASIQPEISLEVALLKANIKLNPSAKLTPETPASSSPAQSSAKPEPLAKNEAKAQKQVPKTDQKTETPEDHAPAISKTSGPTLANLDDKSWQEILKIIKASNNALYSVLRMAKPEYENGVLVLHFKFEFHMKQVVAAKTLVIDAASEVIGQVVTVETVADKELATTQAQKKSRPEPVALATDTKSVIDAFGGGEMVNL
jgi:DNA polymerase III subunit gamma/tau